MFVLPWAGASDNSTQTQIHTKYFGVQSRNCKQGHLLRNTRPDMSFNTVATECFKPPLYCSQTGIVIASIPW